MNIEAAMNMEEFARQVLTLSREEQDEYWNTLKSNPILTTADIETLQKCVGYYRLHTDSNYRKTIKEAVLGMYLEA